MMTADPAPADRTAPAPAALAPAPLDLFALVDRVDGARLMAHLEAFAGWTKHAGTPGERQSLAYVQAALDGFGYATELVLHDAYISLPGPAALTIGGERLACITQSFSRSSPPGGLTAPVVAVGAGTAADFAGRDVAGRIVLVEGIATPGVAQRAGRAGALGQIHLSPSAHAHEMCISPVWGSPTPETLDALPSTVVVTLAAAEGAILKARLEAEPGLAATLEAQVDTGWRETPILVAHLDPPGAADPPFVLFSGHHDTWHYGVMDNGGANATMLEVARLCAEIRPSLRRGLRLCFWSGHSQGRYSGSTWYADQHWAELERRCVAHVNIDSTGARGNTVLDDAQASAELVPLARDAVAAEGGALFGHRIARAGDQSFWGIGVPALFSSLGEQPASGAPAAASFLFGGPNKKGAGTGWWWHTPEDTLDKMDRAVAVRDSRVYLRAVARLLCDPVLPVAYDAQAERLLAEIEALSAGGRVDLSDVRAAAEALREGARALRGEAAGAGGARAERIDRCIMALSRALVPLDYTRGDRFDHDPALPQAPYPALDGVRAVLAAAPGSDAERFARVAARRGLNRAARALAEARRAIETCLEDLAGGLKRDAANGGPHAAR